MANTQDYYNTEMRRTGARSDKLSGAYDERALSFDPYASAEKASVAAGQRLYEMFGEDLGSLRGAEVGSGRLNTGYGAQDEDLLYRDFEDRLSNVLAQNSLQAAGMDLSNIQGIGSMAANTGGEYRAMIAGQLDREQAAKNAKAQRQSSLWSALGRVAGGVGGFMLGGPAGAYFGSQLGGAAAGATAGG